MPNTLDKQYPDTAQGAKDFIVEQSVYKLTDKSVAIADPAIAGVWKVTELTCTFKDNVIETCASAIVYMAGYKDAFGSVREYNDFEYFEGVVENAC